MGYFNAVHGWPSFDALTDSSAYKGGPIAAGRVVTKDPADGKFEIVGAAAPVARVPFITIYDSTDLDIAKTDNDAATFGGYVAQNAVGMSGGNLATLALGQPIEFETSEFIGTPAVDTNLTWYGVAAGDNVATNFGKFRAAVAGEPIVGRVTKALYNAPELAPAAISVLRIQAAAYGQKA